MRDEGEKAGGKWGPVASLKREGGNRGAKGRPEAQKGAVARVLVGTPLQEKLAARRVFEEHGHQFISVTDAELVVRSSSSCF